MSQDRVIVFGASNAGYNVVRALGRNRVCSVVDNDPRKWRAKILGIMVEPPSRIEPHGKERIVIATTFAAEVYEKLLDLGIEPERIEVASIEMMKGLLLPSRRCIAVVVGVILLLTMLVIAGM